MGRTLNVLAHDVDGDTAALIAGLERLGVSARFWYGPAHSPPVSEAGLDAVLISGEAREYLEAAVAAARDGPLKALPLVVISDAAGVTASADAWLRPPASAVQIAARVRAVSRLRVMEDVAKRRAAAAEAFGVAVKADAEADGRPTVLFVGAATPQFMRIRHALSETGSDVIAAFSSYSAFDYLHERAFDAVVLNAIDRKDMAFSISSAMRRNARLYHTPVLLLARPGRFEEADEAFARGVSDLLPADAPAEEIRQRVLCLAQERQRRRRARNTLEACRAARTLDTETGLFHARFATAHLQDLLNASRRDRRATSFVLMRASGPTPSPSGKALGAARRQFAAMLRHLLRGEDAAARLSDDVYAAILPFTDGEGAHCVAERIASIADCTAFEGDDPLRPFRLEVDCVFVDARGEETAEALIERAARLLDSPRVKAG